VLLYDVNTLTVRGEGQIRVLDAAPDGSAAGLTTTRRSSPRANGWTSPNGLVSLAVGPRSRAGFPVEVTISDRACVVPRVYGLRPRAAASKLRKAGCRFQLGGPARRARVVAQTPEPSTVVPRAKRVRVTARR
jgi:hypothetical protein